MQKYLQLFERFIYRYLLFLVFLIPLFLKFPLASVAGSFVAVRLEDVFIALFYLLFGVYLLFAHKVKEFFSSTVVQAFGVFFLIGLVSVYSAVFVTSTVSLQLGLLHLFRRIELMMLFPLAMWLVNSKKRFKEVLTCLFVVLAIVILYALGQKYLAFPVVSTTNSGLSQGVIYYLGAGDRVGSTFAGHYDLAIFLMLALPPLVTTLFYLMQGKLRNLPKLKNKRLFVGLCAALLAAFAVLVLTAARLSFFAAIVGIIMALVFINKKKLIIYFVLLILVALAFPSNLRNRLISTITINVTRSWQGFSAVNTKQLERSQLNISTLPAGEIRQEVGGTEAVDIVPGEPTNTTDLGVFRSFDIRLSVEWPRAVRAFNKNPLLGTGYSSLGVATDNDLLRLLGEVGLLGTTSFVLIVYLVLKLLLKAWRGATGLSRYYLAGVLASFVAFLVNSLFIDVFEASKAASLFWIGLGSAIGRDTHK